MSRTPQTEAPRDGPAGPPPETVHAVLGGLCGCGLCAAQRVTRGEDAAALVQDVGAASVPAPLEPGQIIPAMQFELSLLSDDTMNTTAASPYKFRYQFDDTDPGNLPVADVFTGWRPFTQAERESIRAAMAHIESVANVRFKEVSGAPDPDLNLGAVDLPGNVIGYGGFRYSASSGDGGATWQLVDYDNFAVFERTLDISTQPALILHELGHALTLKHSFDTGAVIPAPFENNKWTVMSYSPNPDIWQNADALQMFDILALQDRWGANMATATGSNRYTGPRTDTTDVIWDAGGATDWLDGARHPDGVDLNLNEGSYSRFGTHEDVAIAYGTQIENARGSRGDDTLTGNALDNTLIGARGHDTLFGGAGNDRLVGHRGSDALWGEDGDDRLEGGRGNDTLHGGAGDDVLLGGRGGDWMDGGPGDDLLTGGRHRDVFVFRLGHDADTVLDFEDDIDTLLFDFPWLENVTQATGLAVQTGAHVAFDFGLGDVLTVQGMTIAALENDIMLA